MIQEYESYKYNLCIDDSLRFFTCPFMSGARHQTVFLCVFALGRFCGWEMMSNISARSMPVIPGGK